MPGLDEISVAIGQLSAKMEMVAQNQRDHQARDDARHDQTQAMIEKLTTHVNHENTLMSDRIEKIEIENAEWDKAEAERRAHNKGMWRVAGALGATVAFIINGIILFFSGALNHWLGG